VTISPKRLLLCVTDDEYTDFLQPHLPAGAAGIEIVRADPKAGAAAVIEALNRTLAPVLMTCWSIKALPADLQARAPSLKYLVHLTGTIRTRVPRAAIENGLLVSNWGPAISRSVAEHCLLQVLACQRRLASLQIGMHVERGWPKTGDGRGLFERSVGLHGFGNVARELVKLMAPFGCRISAFAPGDSDADLRSRSVARCPDLESLYAGNDIVVCLAPWLPQTENSVTEKLLRLIPAGGTFVNTGRGAVVDEDALARVAAEGSLQVALDVYIEEPLPATSPLRGLHIGGPTPDRRRDCGAYALDNLRRFFAGQPVLSVIDPVQYDRQT
jgi:phosphoglycerate dehydrogenase-like enzyme